MGPEFVLIKPNYGSVLYFASRHYWFNGSEWLIMDRHAVECAEKDFARQKKNKPPLLEAARPLIKWLNENCSPHSRCVVERDGVELLTAEQRHLTAEFIQD